MDNTIVLDKIFKGTGKFKEYTQEGLFIRDIDIPIKNFAGREYACRNFAVAKDGRVVWNNRCYASLQDLIDRKEYVRKEDKRPELMSTLPNMQVMSREAHAAAHSRNEKFVIGEIGESNLISKMPSIPVTFHGSGSGESVMQQVKARENFGSAGTAGTAYKLMSADRELVRFNLLGMNVIKYSVQILKQDKLPLDFKNMEDWFDNRINKKVLVSEAAEVGEILDWIDRTYCVSLNDTFWIKRASDATEWKDVNPYKHTLSKRNMQYNLIDGFRDKNDKHSSLEWCINGSFPKIWGGAVQGNYFIKSGSTGVANAGKEPFSEILVNELQEALGISQFCVKYGLDSNDLLEDGAVKSMAVTRCSNLCDEKTGLITADRLGILDYEQAFELAETLNQRSVDSLCLMMLLDCLTVNNDRHMGNIAFMFDTSDVKLIEVSKLYDFNMALLPYYMPEHDGDILEYAEKRQMADDGRKFTELIKLAYEKCNNKPAFKQMLEMAATFKFKPRNSNEEWTLRIQELGRVINHQARKMLSVINGISNAGVKVEFKSNVPEACSGLGINVSSPTLHIPNGSGGVIDIGLPKQNMAPSVLPVARTNTPGNPDMDRMKELVEKLISKKSL